MKLQIKQIRVSRSYSQKEVAAALGIPVRTYGSYEREERSISLEDACAVANFLHCSLDELAGREWSPSEYSDQRQAAINAHFETFNDEARTDVCRMVERMSHDPHARIEKDGAERAQLHEKMGA